MASKLDEIPLLAIEGGEKKKIVVHVDEQDDETTRIDAIGGTRSVVLWPFDFVLILIEFIQLYDVLAILSKSWAWPFAWIDASRFVHVANLDAWEVALLQSGAYLSKNAPVHSADVRIGDATFDYRYYVVAWTGIVLIVAFAFLLAHAIVACIQPIDVLLYRARVRRILAYAAQILCLPFGIAVARLFHCTTETQDGIPEGRLDVFNNITCWSKDHWIYITPPTLILLLYLWIVPLVMIRAIKEQLFSKSGSRHEGYVQLKEAEYVLGMDLMWAVGNFSLFSSFRRGGVFYRPIVCLVKCLVIVFFAGLTRWPEVQIIAISSTFFLVGLLFLALRPFRLPIFNILIICLWIVLTCYGVIGILLELDVENSLLTGRFLLGDVIAITGAGLLILIVSLCYMCTRHCRARDDSATRSPLWPSLTHSASGTLDKNTSKYLKAILRGRRVLEACRAVAPTLAPAHELSHHIQIINAYCREAEQLDDPIHDTLWDLLDELIEAHSNVFSDSIYSTSSKSNLHRVARELNELMPAFRKRLDQREYDFALVSRVRRRMLLKMYIIGMFVNGRAEKAKLKQQKVDIKVGYLTPDVEKESSLMTLGDSDVDTDNDTLLEKVEELMGGTGDSKEDLLREVENIMGEKDSPV